MKWKQFMAEICVQSIAQHTHTHADNLEFKWNRLPSLTVINWFSSEELLGNRAWLEAIEILKINIRWISLSFAHQLHNSTTRGGEDGKLMKTLSNILSVAKFSAAYTPSGHSQISQQMNESWLSHISIVRWLAYK